MEGGEKKGRRWQARASRAEQSVSTQHCVVRRQEAPHAAQPHISHIRKRQSRRTTETRSTLTSASWDGNRRGASQSRARNRNTVHADVSELGRQPPRRVTRWLGPCFRREKSMASKARQHSKRMSATPPQGSSEFKTKRRLNRANSVIP